MNFFCQKVVCFLINYFRNWLLIVIYKSTTKRRYKHQQIDKSEKKKNDEFDEYESNDRYISLPPLFPQTEANRHSYLNEEPRSLTYLISIIKKNLARQVLT